MKTISIFFWLMVLSLILTITPVQAAEVKVSWQPSENAVGYRVYYGVDTADMKFSINTGRATTYTVQHLQCNTEYFFKVKAYNGAGESGPSNTVSKITDSCPEKPTPPEGWEVTGLVITPIK